MKFHRAYVEVTNVCGLACTFCPPKLNPTTTMELPFFKKVVEELSAYTDEIALHVMGDPMVLTNLREYLEIAYASGLKVMITTSGFYLDSARREALFHPSIRQINISLNSFNKNSVSRSFESYMDPILELCDEKLLRSKDFFINLRVWNLDEEQSEKEFNEKLFELLERHFDLEEGSVASQINGERQSIRLASKILLHFDRYFEWPSLSNTHESDGYCQGLDKQIAVLSDGRVVPCCLDSEGIMELGNLRETNLGKILKTKRSLAVVNGFAKGICSEELCQKCSYKERFNTKEQTCQKTY
ncbi:MULTISPECIES: radical SAM/SPASM domain-containing protein [unclassified Sulfuricurvum]|uniref:radical SAM/SPASM domain-containing protein n=1 Tax=unclassified Sulfuricurvum TaxID=2632390 RepID=UPI0002998A96|nr:MULTISPECIES: radical SAM protein [unclassified Sulfuricurvum]AFV98463.1 radical sam domain-containing protein [Candidatus Sulfuricurvum sp. RIFRC-1]HBM36657.1 radical SAM protein [Sulfuricurvum sp.]